MSRKKQNKWAGYASYMHVSSDHFSKAKKQYSDLSLAGKKVEELVHAGYSVSFSTKEFEGSNAVVCKFTGTYTDDNKGVTLSSFAATFESALALNLYKHFEMCDNGIWPTKARSSFG